MYIILNFALTWIFRILNKLVFSQQGGGCLALYMGLIYGLVIVALFLGGVISQREDL